MRTLVVVSAGLREPSSTRLLADRLAAVAARSLREQGEEVDVTVVDLREHARGLADHLVTGFGPAPLRAALDAVASADGVVAVTPVYSGTFSGLFKTFVDVLEPGALEGTPVLVGATGGTARHSQALDFALRPLFAHLRAAVVPTGVFAATDDWASGSGDSPLVGRIDRAGRELAIAVARTPRSVPGRRRAAAVPAVPVVPDPGSPGGTPDFARLLADLGQDR